MKINHCHLFSAGLLAVAVMLAVAGCSGFERHKYVFWGEVVTEKPVTIEDHWSDYGPFKLNDPTKKLRRGKAGVIRFFKEKEYVHSIPVDGNLVVYVYKGNEEGVELTEPFARLVLTSEQLNSQRKFDKENGYSYHIWLDLGEIDEPPENISILTVFNDAKTRDQVASGITYTRIDGVQPPEALKADEKQMLTPDKWAKQYKEQNNIPTLTDAEKEKYNIKPESSPETENNAASNGTVIDLSPAMAQQIQYANASETPSSAENRFASYLQEKNNQQPQMQMQTGTVPLTAMQTYTAGTPRKMTFDELRQATGPTPDGQLYSHGYGNNNQSVQSTAQELTPDAGNSTGRLY